MATPMLILGTAQVIPNYGITRVRIGGIDRWSAIFAEAARQGFTTVDTAHAYEGAHDVIKRSGWAGDIHTKLASIESLETDFEGAKRSLGRNSLEVVYLHKLPMGVDEINHVRTSGSRLLENGASALGVSVYSPSELRVASEIEEISIVQIPLSALDQRFIGAPIKRMVSTRKKVIVRSVFLQGLLVGSLPTMALKTIPSALLPKVRRFHETAEKIGIPALELALLFISGLDNLHGIVIGCESAEQVREVGETWRKVQQSPLHGLSFGKFSVRDSKVIEPRNWPVVPVAT